MNLAVKILEGCFYPANFMLGQSFVLSKLYHPLKFLTIISSLNQQGFNLSNCAGEILNYLMQCSPLAYPVYQRMI